MGQRDLFFKFVRFYIKGKKKFLVIIEGTWIKVVQNINVIFINKRIIIIRNFLVVNLYKFLLGGVVLGYYVLDFDVFMVILRIFSIIMCFFFCCCSIFSLLLY